MKVKVLRDFKSEHYSNLGFRYLSKAITYKTDIKGWKLQLINYRYHPGDEVRFESIELDIGEFNEFMDLMYQETALHKLYENEIEIEE